MSPKNSKDLFLIRFIVRKTRDYYYDSMNKFAQKDGSGSRNSRLRIYVVEPMETNE